MELKIDDVTVTWDGTKKYATENLRIDRDECVKIIETALDSEEDDLGKIAIVIANIDPRAFFALAVEGLGKFYEGYYMLKKAMEATHEKH